MKDLPIKITQTLEQFTTTKRGNYSPCAINHAETNQACDGDHGEDSGFFV